MKITFEQHEQMQISRKNLLLSYVKKWIKKFFKYTEDIEGMDKNTFIADVEISAQAWEYLHNLGKWVSDLRTSGFEHEKSAPNINWDNIEKYKDLSGKVENTILWDILKNDLPKIRSDLEILLASPEIEDRYTEEEKIASPAFPLNH